ncbi:MAG: hypothetical protein DRJ47_04830, partial [Thermoprotei archaeon]
EACIDYLLNYIVPKCCPRHQDFLGMYNVALFFEGFKPAARYRQELNRIKFYIIMQNLDSL